MSTSTDLAQAQSSMAGPHAFTEDILDALTMASWPDGSPLIDVAPDILRERLAARILQSAYALAAISGVQR